MEHNSPFRLPLCGLGVRLVPDRGVRCHGFLGGKIPKLVQRTMTDYKRLIYKA